MKVDFTKDRFLNDAIASTIHQDDAMREVNKYAAVVKEVNQWEDMKKAAVGLTTADYMTSAVAKMDLAATVGLTSSALEDFRRTEELRKSVTAPSGIAGMVIENMSRLESGSDLHYPAPEQRVPSFDYVAIRPMPDPMRETNKNLKETKALQAKMAEHLEELVTQAKGTTNQNVKMIKLSTASLVFTVVGIILSTIVGVLSYYAGKSSSPSASQSTPAVKAISVPVVSTPAITKK